MRVLNGVGENDMAVIMTAYSDFSFVLKNIEYLHKGFDIFIHVDRKKDIPDSFIEECRNYSNVWIDNSYRINWGGYEHLKAIVDLMVFASTIREYNRYVVMSENEASLFTVQTIKDFFYKNIDKNFIGMTDINQTDNSLDRVNSYHFQHRYDIRDKSILGKVKSFFWRGLQVALRKFNIRPNFKHIYRYKGYVYCALNDVAINWINANWKMVQEAIEESKYLYVAEEYVLHNLFMEDSTLRDTVVNDSLIFDDWTKPELGTPRYLVEEDFSEIVQSNKVFFRKIGSDSKLVEVIYKIDNKLS